MNLRRSQQRASILAIALLLGVSTSGCVDSIPFFRPADSLKLEPSEVWTEPLSIEEDANQDKVHDALEGLTSDESDDIPEVAGVLVPEMMVALNVLPDEQLIQNFTSRGIIVGWWDPDLPFLFAKVDSVGAFMLGKDERVHSVVPAPAVETSNLQSRSFTRIEAQTALISETVENVQGLTGEGSIIAIIDNGIDSTHPCFGKGQVVHQEQFEAAWYDWGDRLAFSADGNTHGTAVACTAVGNGDSWSLLGMATGAHLIDLELQMYSDDCPGDSSKKCNYFYKSTILNATDYVRRHADTRWTNSHSGIDIVSMSLGEPSGLFTPEKGGVLEDIHERGILAVAAVGNEARQGINWPASHRDVLAVGALDSATQGPWRESHDKGSNWGPTRNTQNPSAMERKPEILAPGARIQTARSGGGATALSGTSMATPIVAGIAAIMLEAYPDATPSDLRSALIESAKPLHGFACGKAYGSWTAKCGYGAVNAFEAVKEIYEIRGYTDSPTVSIDGPDRIEPGEEASFQSIFEGQRPTQYQWYINGEEAGNEANLEIDGPPVGNYRIELDAWQFTGHKATAEHLLEVTEELTEPVAQFRWSPRTVYVGDEVQLKDRSDPSEGEEIVSWEWTIEGYGTSTESDPFVEWNSEGTYTVQLVVTDSAGKTDDVSDEVTVDSVPEETPSEDQPTEEDQEGQTDLGAQSELQIMGGTGTFANIIDQGRSVSVEPGARLTGTVELSATNPWPSWAIAPLVGTPSWGDPWNAYWTIDSWIDEGASSHVANVDIIAPQNEGTYHLIFAFRAEKQGDEVASATNWAYGDPVWGDGNDVAKMSIAQVSDCQRDFQTRNEWLLEDGSRSNLWLPCDVITINVAEGSSSGDQTDEGGDQDGPTGYGAQSELQIVGGSGTFDNVVSQGRSVSVEPGARLAGTVELDANNPWPGWAIAPLIGTPSWGDPWNAYWTIDSWIDEGASSHVANVDIIAPQNSGTYHLIFAFAAEKKGDEVASATNWAYGDPVWGDGNDIAELSSVQVDECQSDFRTTNEWLMEDGSRSDAWLPCDVITIQVGD